MLSFRLTKHGHTAIHMQEPKTQQSKLQVTVCLLSHTVTRTHHHSTCPNLCRKRLQWFAAMFVHSSCGSPISFIILQLKFGNHDRTSKHRQTKRKDGCVVQMRAASNSALPRDAKRSASTKATTVTEIVLDHFPK